MNSIEGYSETANAITAAVAGGASAACRYCDMRLPYGIRRLRPSAARRVSQARAQRPARSVA